MSDFEELICNLKLIEDLTDRLCIDRDLSNKVADSLKVFYVDKIIAEECEKASKGINDE